MKAKIDKTAAINTIVIAVENSNLCKNFTKEFD